MITSSECLINLIRLLYILIKRERCLAENNALWRDSMSWFHHHAGWSQGLRHDISNKELWKPDKKCQGRMILKHLDDCCTKRINIYLNLQGWLAVRHSGRALGADNDGHMEAVAGESSSSARDTEGFRQGVPRFLAENWVYQLDDLILGLKHLTDSVQIKMHRWKWNRKNKIKKTPTQSVPLSVGAPCPHDQRGNKQRSRKEQSPQVPLQTVGRGLQDHPNGLSGP